MKRFIVWIAVSLAAAFSLSAAAQSARCDVTGPPGYNGPYAPSINFECGNQAPPPTCTPPDVLDPSTNTCVTPPPVTDCSESQTATVAGKTFKRQCSGTMLVLPRGIGYDGALTDLGKVLGNTTFPNYAYSGQSPTFVITSSYYVSLAFKPTVAGSIRWIANSSYGDGGTISISTRPGQLTAAAGAVCAYGLGSMNNMMASTASGQCRLTLGTTYYINFADTNPSGQLLCFGAAAGSCSESSVSYGFTAKAL